MAITTSIHGELRGSIGGNTWSRNKGGMYIRQRITPTNPNSSRQQTTRNFIADCAVAWASTLTEAEREEWREWAETNTWKNSLGVDIALTALDWFTMVNTRLLDVAAAKITSPGDLSAPAPLLTMSITLPTTTSVAVAFTPVLAAGFRLVAWGSGPLNVGRNPNFRQCRLIGYSAAAAASPVTLVLPYTVVIGQKLKVFIGQMNAKGRISTFLTDVETKA
jgi:hypothetical protein